MRIRKVRGQFVLVSMIGGARKWWRPPPHARKMSDTIPEVMLFGLNAAARGWPRRSKARR